MPWTPRFFWGLRTLTSPCCSCCSARCMVPSALQAPWHPRVCGVRGGGWVAVDTAEPPSMLGSSEVSER